MPPKSDNAVADQRANDIVALCHVIMSCDEFKADSNKLARVLNIAQAKNVPRKINSIVKPFGFEFKLGRIIASNDNPPATPSRKANDDDDGDNDTPETKPKSKATPKKNGTTPKKPKSNKKRKIDSDEDVDDNGNGGSKSVKEEHAIEAEDNVDGDKGDDEDLPVKKDADNEQD